MAVKKEDAITYIGYTDAELEAFENIDAFKADYDSKMIRRENALKDKEFKTKVTGELLGSLTTKAKSIAKSFGVEYQPDEIKDQPLEKIIELGYSKITTASTKALEEVNAKIGAKPDKLVQEWEEKYNKLNVSFEDTKKLLDGTKNEFNSYKEKTAAEIKNSKLTFQEEQEFSKIESMFKPNINEVEKIGFRSAIKAQAKFDFDESGKMIVTDLEGHLIPNKSKHGEFMKPDEYLKEAGLKLGVIPTNPHSKPIAKQPIPVTQNGDGHQSENKPTRVNSYRPKVGTP